MNEKLQKFAREELKDGLNQLPEKWQNMFKRIYSHNDLDKNINDVVDALPCDKIDNAMVQVENSLDKLSN